MCRSLAPSSLLAAAGEFWNFWIRIVGAEIYKVSEAFVHRMLVLIPWPICLGGHEALRVFRSRLRDNASMYDFVNIFTEYAKGLPNGQKIDVETKAGALASWIAENKRKFA
jgi:hypothetical protein